MSIGFFFLREMSIGFDIEKLILLSISFILVQKKYEILHLQNSIKSVISKQIKIRLY